MKCKDCQYMKLKKDPLGLESPIHYCLLTTSCDGKPNYRRTLAYAKDYENYHAVLIVSPEFGCVQFEQRAMS